MPTMEFTEYEKKQVIAVGSGWTRVKDGHGNIIPGPYWNDPSGRYMGGNSHDPLPDYFKSHEACEKVTSCLTSKHWNQYLTHLAIECCVDFYDVGNTVRIMAMCNASAAKKAEALYKTFLSIF